MAPQSDFQYPHGAVPTFFHRTRSIAMTDGELEIVERLKQIARALTVTNVMLLLLLLVEYCRR